jgi:hypothetical protein
MLKKRVSYFIPIEVEPAFRFIVVQLEVSKSATIYFFSAISF